jgi:hypothetical protein
MGIPEWKKQLSVPELCSHPFLEREDIKIKDSSFFLAESLVETTFLKLRC